MTSMTLKVVRGVSLTVGLAIVLSACGQSSTIATVNTSPKSSATAAATPAATPTTAAATVAPAAQKTPPGKFTFTFTCADSAGHKIAVTTYRDVKSAAGLTCPPKFPRMSGLKVKANQTITNKSTKVTVTSPTAQHSTSPTPKPSSTSGLVKPIAGTPTTGTVTCPDYRNKGAENWTRCWGGGYVSETDLAVHCPSFTSTSNSLWSKCWGGLVPGTSLVAGKMLTCKALDSTKLYWHYTYDILPPVGGNYGFYSGPKQWGDNVQGYPMLSQGAIDVVHLNVDVFFMSWIDPYAVTGVSLDLRSEIKSICS